MNTTENNKEVLIVRVQRNTITWESFQREYERMCQERETRKLMDEMNLKPGSLWNLL